MIKFNRVNERNILIGIFVLALVLRLAYLQQVKSGPLFYPLASGMDDTFYHQQAQEIANGNWLGEGPFSAMPLYPYFLGLIYKIFGPQVIIVKLIQFLLGALSCILIYLIAKKIFGPVAAIIAALAACVYGPFIFYEEVLVAEALTAFLYLLGFLALLWAWERPSARRFLIFGLAAGLSALAKASILLFIPVVIGLLLYKTRPLKTALLFTAWIALGLMLTIAPVAWRNYLVSKEFIPITTHGGINFYIGNNEHANGAFRTPLELGSTPRGLLTNSKIVAEKLAGRNLKLSQASQFWFSQGMTFIQTQPAKYVQLLGRKLLLLINFYEVPDVRDYHFAQTQTPLLKFLFGFGLIFIFSILGLLLAKGDNFPRLLLKLFTLTYVISILLFFVNSRYRLPLMPFMIILAGAGAEQYVLILKKRRYLQAAILVLPLGLAIFLGNLSLLPRSFGGSDNLVGLYYLEHGAYPQAIVQFQKAVEDKSQQDNAYYNMGKAYMALGENTLAIDSFDKSLKANPYHYDAYNDQGTIYLSQGKLDEAYRVFARAAEINPNYAAAHANLGLVYKEMKLEELAIQEYNRAVELDPSLAGPINNNIGLVYLGKNKPDEALLYFTRAVTYSPNLVQAHYNRGLVLAQKGLLAEARREWEKTLELEPGFADTREKLDRLKKAGY